MSTEEKKSLCEEFIQKSTLLSRLPIVSDFHGGKENEIRVIDVQARYQKLDTSDETHDFLQCPVVYVTNVNVQRKSTLYVMPVVFEDAERCGRYHFVQLSIPRDGENEERELLAYSKLAKHESYRNGREINSDYRDNREGDVTCADEFCSFVNPET